MATAMVKLAAEFRQDLLDHAHDYHYNLQIKQGFFMQQINLNATNP
jgi:hypothetical protein